MQRLLLVCLSFTAPLVMAIPVPRPCQSNVWEKVHENHFHDINSGVWFGVPLGLRFPGGSGCYKGETSAGYTDNHSAPDFDKIPEGWGLDWMPGYADAAKANGWDNNRKTSTSSSTNQPAASYQPTMPQMPPRPTYAPASNPLPVYNPATNQQAPQGITDQGVQASAPLPMPENGQIPDGYSVVSVPALSENP